METNIRISSLFGFFISLLLINTAYLCDIFEGLWVSVNLSVFLIYFLTNYLCASKGIDSYVVKLCNYTILLKIFLVILIRYFALQEYGYAFIPSPDVIAFNKFAEIAVSQNASFLKGFFFHPADPGIWVMYHFVYSILGEDPIFIQFISLICSTLIIIYSYRLVLITINEERVAKVTALLVALFPSFYSFVIFTHKDMIGAFLILFIVYLVIALKDQFSSWRLAIFPVALILLYFLRTEAAIVVVGLSFFYWIVKVKKISVKLPAVIGVIIFLAFLYPSLAQMEMVKGFGYSEVPEELISRIENNQAKSAGETGIGESIRRSSFVPRTVLGSIYLLIKPFPPWETMTDFDFSMLLSFSSIAILFLIPWGIKGLIIAWKRRLTELFVPFVMMVSIIVGTAIAYGPGPFRYRFQVMAFMLIYVALGIVYPNKNKFVDIGYAFLIAIGFLTLIILRLG